jgi:hypothetical protein
MFVLCIARQSINNQHYTLDYITSLFNMQARTCFGSRVPSSGSFLDPCELLEKQNNCVVYHMCLWPVCQSVVVHYMIDHILVLLFN